MDFLFGIAIAAFILLGPWVVALRALGKARKNSELAEQRWDILQARLHTIDGFISGLRAAIDQLAKAAPVHAPQTEEPAPSAASPKPANVPIEDAVRLRELAPQSHEPVPAPAPVATPPPLPPLPEIPIAARTEAHELPTAAPTSAPPQPTVAPASPPNSGPPDRLGLEEKVGTNWLNKIGIVLLVLGVAFLISTLMKTLGPAGKVLVGLTVSASLLASGVFFERLERYRLLARAGIGGGWALLFFTAYAMHHVAAARVIESQTLDLALMMAVAAAMVWHTLRYNSQVVTGLAFLLAFATVNIGRGSVFSLTAGVVLAAALCVLVIRRGWFELEIFAILATYLNHLFWLWPIIEPMGGHHHMFREFIPSASILACYWLIFRISYIVRDIARNSAFQQALNTLEVEETSDAQAAEAVSTFAALLNGGFFLAIMRYQSVRPELAFWFLLGLGFAELLLGQLPITRRRRSAFIVLTVIGSALIVAAIPFRYSGMSLAVLWIAEAQALILAGIGTDEPVFRRLGLLAMLPPAFTLLLRDPARASVQPNFKLALVCAFASIACYLDSEVFSRRWARMFRETYGAVYLKGLSYAGAILAIVAIWAGVHDAWTGTLWALLGFALAIIGNRLRVATLATQANVLAAAALVRALTVNIEISGSFHTIGLRLITVACVAALLYLSSPWTAVERRGRIPSAYTWAASFLVSLLAWYELRPVSVAVAWALFGVVLIELGLVRRMRDLSAQGLVALAAAFTRIFFVNLNAGASAGQLSPRVYTVIPIALIFYYCYERLRTANVDEDLSKPDWQRSSAPALCWFSVISIAAVARFEINVDWVVAMWAAGAVALLLAARGLQRSIFLHQALVAAVAVLFRGIFHNFYERSYFEGHWAGASKAVIIAATLLLGSLPIAFALRTRDQAPDSGRNWFTKFLNALESQPHQLIFFVPLALITVLLAIELRTGMITVAWGIEGVVVFVAALFAGERSYRLTGLGLLLLCVGKILFIDVWQMQGTDRYLTLIVTGSALLLVSFLYSRYREALREYL